MFKLEVHSMYAFKVGTQNSKHAALASSAKYEITVNE